MKTLPNGLTIFNATPHVIRFWCKEWQEPVEVETDKVISASVEEREVGRCSNPAITFVSPAFLPTEEGRCIYRHAVEVGADVVIGSIITAQAYPGQVVAMTPAPGYERVPPAEKRMNPDKFTVF